MEKEDQLSSRLIIEKTSRVSKYAVIDKDKLVFFEVIKHNLPLTDEIYLGRVEKYNETMMVAFINIGKTNVFVPSKNKLPVGQEVLIQIVKPPEKNKLARGTLDITIGKEYAVAIFNEEGVRSSTKCKNNPATIELIRTLDECLDVKFGILLRSQSTINELAEVEEEIRELKRIIENFTGEIGLQYSPFGDLDYIRDKIESYTITKIICNDRAILTKIRREAGFTKIDFELDEFLPLIRNRVNLQNFLNPEIEFKNFRLTFNFVEALCIIDIDSSFSQKTSLRNIQIRKVNEGAFREILSVIEIYKISGMVLIDFISMDRANTNLLSDFIISAIKEHHSKLSIKLHSLSNTGLAQIIIEKKSNNIVASISKNCPCCNGSGLVLDDDILLDQFEIELQAKIGEKKDRYEVQIPHYLGIETKEKIQEIALEKGINISLAMCDITQINMI